MTRNRGWVWITRDSNSDSGYVVWGRSVRPSLKVTPRYRTDVLTYDVVWKGSGRLLEMCRDGFERVMQYRLPPGACEKVRLGLTPVLYTRKKLGR